MMGTHAENSKKDFNLDVLSLPLNRSSMIRASAGTGKTFTITLLAVRLLLGDIRGIHSDGTTFEPKPVLTADKLLVVTFTKAAAAELRARVRQRVHQARELFHKTAAGEAPKDKDDPLIRLVLELTNNGTDRACAEKCSRILDQAERQLDDAAICTIHSFCDRALNKIFSFESGEPFQTKLSDDISEELDEAVSDVWREIFYSGENTADQILDVIGGTDPLDRDTGVLQRIDQLENVAASQASLDDKSGIFMGYRVSGAEFNQAISGLDPLKPSRTGIRKALFEYAGKKQRELSELISQIVQKLPEFHDKYRIAKDQGSLGTIKKDPAAAMSAINSLSDDCSYDELITSLRGCGIYETAEEVINQRSKSKITAEVQELADIFIEISGTFGRYEKKLVSLKETEITLIALMALDRCSEICRRDHVLSFNGLIRELDKALYRKKDAAGSRLASTLRRQYPVVMIDESQDTDPMQYSIFKKIYLTTEAKKDGACCLFIGDPKQSIYSFRNADIHSYNQAGKDIRDLFDGGNDEIAESNVLKLPVNYRSNEDVVESVNDIFRGFGIPNDAVVKPFCDKSAQDSSAITYEKVGANKGKRVLCLDNEENPCSGCRVVFVNDECKGNSTSASASAIVAARDIAKCLARGKLFDEKKQVTRPVEPSDIAVLVNSGTQSALISKCLSDLGIGSVYFSDRSSVMFDVELKGTYQRVRPTEAAQCLIDFMEAMQSYQAPGRVIRLMGTRLCGLDSSGFVSFCSDEKALESESTSLREAKELWERFGFLSAFRTWCYKHKTIGRIEKTDGGERFLTDCFQIAELVQEHTNQIPGTMAQLKWLRNQSQNEGNSADAVRKRLESENKQVKIYTIHMSKGLEFPIVFLPFVWVPRKNENSEGAPIRYYDFRDGKGCYRLDLDGSPESVNREFEDSLEEECRKLYVALTRAETANYIYITNENFNPRKISALALELTRWDKASCGPVKSKKSAAKDSVKSLGEQCFDQLRQNAEKTGGRYSFRKTSGEEAKADSEAFKRARAKPEEKQSELIVSDIQKGAIKQDFSVSSYTAVTRGLHDREFEQNDVAADQEARKVRTERAAPDRFNFPRGTKAGTFLHEALQVCPFDRIADSEEMNKFKVHHAAIAQTRGLLEQWKQNSLPEEASYPDSPDPLEKWFTDITRARLPIGGDKSFRLCDLRAGDWIPEMEYLIPADGNISAQRLNALCIKSAKKVLGHEPEPPLVLDEKTLHGYVTGSLDLVMRVPGTDAAHDLYYVADYKSTHLGDSPECYNKDAVRKSVFDPHNRYDVQYLFYTLALHRFLKERLGDLYSYERNFGGVLYLYLRGLYEEPAAGGSGIFMTKPDEEIVNELDEMFRGR